MKSNAKATLGLPNTINPLTKMWRLISNFVILFCNISKYVKLIEIARLQVLGLVEDEWVFYNLNFIKIKDSKSID
jgi:hypothetical protein